MNEQIVVKNLLISYSVFGDKEASKSLLFLHGWRSQKEVWMGTVDQLISESVNQQISFYAIDLPGFGGSQNPHPDPLPEGEGGSTGWSVGDYADVVKDFIEKLDLKNVIIVGHSFGGRVGIKLASKYPQLISKLVLVDSAGFAVNDSKKNLIKAAAKIAKPFFKPKFMQGLRNKIYKSMGSEDYLATPELQKTFVNVVNEDLTEDMKKIICPTLILNGENDADTPVEFGKRMNSLISARGGSASGGHNSKFVILKNAGHFSFLDQKDEFVKILSSFIK